MPLINVKLIFISNGKNCILVTGAEANQNPMFQINEVFCNSFINSKKYETP